MGEGVPKWTSFNRSGGIPSVHVVRDRGPIHVIGHMGIPPANTKDITEYITFPQTTYPGGENINSDNGQKNSSHVDVRSFIM